MAWPSARAKTATAGGSWVPADMNAVQDQYLRATGILNSDLDPTTVTAMLGLSDGTSVRRGKSIIATTESRSNVAYGTLTTPDQVSNIVLPTDGIIWIGYQATWQESNVGQASAAIFIGANQLKAVNGTASAAVQAASIGGAGVANTDYPLATSAGGLLGIAAVAYAGDVTTGQIVGNANTSANPSGYGFIPVFAAAGTYTVSVQFKAAAGSVTAKNRKLWVRAEGF